MKERPTLAFYHANAKGKGSGIKIAIENSMALIAFGVNERWEDAK